MDANTLKNLLQHLAAGGRNAPIAARVGCDRRTVRRYRRACYALGVPASALADIDPVGLRAIFNARAPRHAEPDFSALDAEFPATSARFRYERYRERRLAMGSPAMSVAQFNRLRAEYEFRTAGFARFAPLMPGISASAIQRWLP